MATNSSLARLSPKLQSIFGLINSSDDAKIRTILNNIDGMLLDFAKCLGVNRAGWEGTGLDLIWFPSGQVNISSFIGAGIKGSSLVDFVISLQPTWSRINFPIEPAWMIEAEIYADCQHKIDHESMHLVFQLPIVTKTHPIDAVIELRNVTAELIKLGKEKPLEYWLQLASDNPV
jgi:hypothetical protein